MKDCRMIVVDDEWGIRMLLREVFAEVGITVMEARCYEEAINIAKRFQLDLALVDMHLGYGCKHNGTDVIRSLKCYNPRMCSILVTADPESHIIRKAFSKGAVCCLGKPFNIDYLMHIVKDLYDLGDQKIRVV